MKKIQVTIKGNDLLMNKFNMEAMLDSKGGKRTTQNYDPKVEAEKSAYWSSDGKKQLVIPATCMYASILNASSFYKIQKRSAKTILAGSIRVSPKEIPLGTDKYSVDIRPVVINRARVIKGRAWLPKWEASFEILFNEQIIPDPAIIKSILEEAGTRIGVLDFRPQKGGPFGTFEVTKFKVVD